MQKGVEGTHACPSCFVASRHFDRTLSYAIHAYVGPMHNLPQSAVKVFFEDTLKFFRLPVLSMSISDDDDLIVTASADKNVKIWGQSFVHSAGTFCT